MNGAPEQRTPFGETDMSDRDDDELTARLFGFHPETDDDDADDDAAIAAIVRSRLLQGAPIATPKLEAIPDSVIATDRVSKRFGAVQALSDVSIDLRPGEVHAIVGENGAGKSTLMKILSGVERPDEGRIIVRGQPVSLRHPIDAERLGISMIHQELNLVDDLSVADNIFLGREKSV